MLILKKEFTTGDYVTVKLLTGDEIFGRVKTIDDKQLELDKPRTIIPTSDGMMMVNYIQLGDDVSYSFARTSIVTIGNLAKQVKQDYVQAVSGLTIV